MKRIHWAYFLIALFSVTACDLLNQTETPIEEEITDDISSPTTWKSNGTYIISGTVRVRADLTIEPGTVVKFKTNARLDIAYWGDDFARIIANGTGEKPIRFTSESPNPSAGNWGTIALYKGAQNSEFNFCIFEYGGADQTYGNVYIDEASIKISNCQFRNIKNSAIILTDNASFNEFVNNSFSNIEKHAVEIDANQVHTIGTGNVFSLNPLYGIMIKNDFDRAGIYTWLAHNAPYVVSETIRIGSEGNGVDLTIQAGSVIRFTNDKKWDIAYWDAHFAKITAIGTAENPIIFTSNSPNPIPGSYRGLYFYEGSNNSVFHHCIFEYGALESNYGCIYGEETNLSFENCQFKNMKYSAINFNSNSYFNSFTNNTFENNQHHPIRIYANHAHTIGASNSFNAGGFGIVVTGDIDREGTYTWRNHDAPYIIDDVIRIGSEGNGVTLNIEAGTILKFNLDKGLEMAYWDSHYGKIIAQGTAQNPIIFTSSKPVPEKGDWKGLYFYKGVNGSSFQHCQILYAGRTANYGAFGLFDAGHNTITLDNVRIAYSNGHAITYDDYSSVNISTVTFDNNNGNNYHKR